MTTEQKRKALQDLGKKRQAKAYDGHNNIGDYHNGVYESEWVSPYTKAAQNVGADVFIMLQDWSSDDSLRKPIHHDVVEHGYSPNYPTNLNLNRLLKKHLGLELKDCFATNLFPFIKKAGMSATISSSDLVRAAREFGIPQIEIVNPKLVITLGIPTFNALRKARGLKPVGTIEEGIASPFEIGNSKVVCQAHTGQLGKNNRNRGGENRVDGDWMNLKIFLRKKPVNAITTSPTLRPLEELQKNQQFHSVGNVDFGPESFRFIYETFKSWLKAGFHTPLKLIDGIEYTFLKKSHNLIYVYTANKKYVRVDEYFVQSMYSNSMFALAELSRNNYSILFLRIKYADILSKHLQHSMLTYRRILDRKYPWKDAFGLFKLWWLKNRKFQFIDKSNKTFIIDEISENDSWVIKYSDKKKEYINGEILRIMYEIGFFYKLNKDKTYDRITKDSEVVKGSALEKVLKRIVEISK